jgi:DNA-binding response OmpR family regulator
MSRILLIDDDRELAMMLAEYLSDEGFTVETAHDGDAGLDIAVAGGFDAVVLDVMLPGRDGYEVLRQLRRGDDNTPVLMLTARGEDVDTVVGLELGADDYLPKPCNPRVLVARLRALLRRGAAAPQVSRIELDDLVLDTGRREVSVGGAEVTLTGAEFALLAELVAAAGQVVDKDRLCEAALGRRLQAYDRSVDMHLSHLRRKLGPLPDGSARIKTVRGAGYQYVSSP